MGIRQGNFGAGWRQSNEANNSLESGAVGADSGSLIK
jgi:hypothetical protein